MSQSSNLVIYSPVKYHKPQLATKSLIVNAKGKRDKISHFKNVPRGFISIQQFSTFDEFSNLLFYLESNHHAFILRGSVRDGVNLNKPQARRKDLAKWTAKGQGASVAFKESDETWLGFDIDKMPLSHLGIDKPVEQLDIPTTIRLLINTYVPELANISCHYQLSSSCGWTDSTSLSCHLFFILKSPLSNPQAKSFASAVNERAGFGLFDTALYQAVQPHFTAAPIIVAPAIDPLAGKRSGIIRYANDFLDLDVDELLLDKPQAQQKPRKPRKTPPLKNDKPLYKPVIHNIATLDGWIKHFETIENLHDEVRSFSNWIYSHKFWGLTKADEKKVFAALKKSPRIKKEPARLDKFVNDGEYKDLMDSARDRQLLQRLERYRTNFLKADITESSKWVSFLWTMILSKLGSKKIILLIASMGVGKTTWLQKNVFGPTKDFCSRHDTSIVVTLLRFLAKQWSSTIKGLDDYELVKKQSKQEKQNAPIYNLSVCLNSIINGGISDFLPEAPTLIIDECEATLEAIFSGTIASKDRQAILDQLGAIIADAKLVIGAQHNISNLTLKFFEYFGIKRSDILILENTYKRYQGLPCYFHQSDKGLIEELHKTIGKGERCMVASNSKQDIEKLYAGLAKAYPDLKQNHRTITADNSQGVEQQAFLADPTEQSKLVKVVLYSPSMGTGVSQENPDYKRTFGFFNSLAGNSPSDCVQMLFRSRTLKRIDYFVDTRHNYMPTNPIFYIAQAYKSFEFCHSLDSFDDRCGFQPTETESKLLRLHAEVLTKQAREKQDFCGNLYAELKEGMGCNVQFIEIQDKKFEQGKAIKKESSEIVRTNNKGVILRADKVSRTQYEDMIKRDKQDSLPARRRFEFEDVMQVDVDNYPEFKPVNDSIVDEFIEYEKANPEIAQALSDYENGRIKKKHLIISEASTPAPEAKRYAKFLAGKQETVELQKAAYLSFWIRWNLFNLLLPLVGLKAENWGIEAIEGFEFTYADVLANKPFMAFCTKHAQALQVSGLTRFRGKRPTAKTFGYWLSDMGLKPKTRQKGAKGKQVRVLTWDNCLDVPTTRLLSKYNAIKNSLTMLESIVIDSMDNQLEQGNDDIYTIDDDDNEFAYMNEDGYQVYTWGYKD